VAAVLAGDGRRDDFAVLGRSSGGRRHQMVRAGGAPLAQAV